MKLTKLAVTVVASALISSTFAITVNFDELANGTVLTNQYPGLTFSSNAGSEIRIYGFSTASTAPNILCTFQVGGDITCTGDTNIDFANPANNVMIDCIEPNSPTTAANIGVWQNGSFTGMVAVPGLGGSGNSLVDLSSFANITRLEMHCDPSEFGAGGVGWDTLRYEAVPEPASMTALAIGGLALIRRKRNSK